MGEEEQDAQQDCGGEERCHRPDDDRTLLRVRGLRINQPVEQASPRWREVDAKVLRERAVNCVLYTRRSRYPDLHAKYCAAGRCDTRALDKHFLNEGLNERRVIDSSSRLRTQLAA